MKNILELLLKMLVAQPGTIFLFLDILLSETVCSQIRMCAIKSGNHFSRTMLNIFKMYLKKNSFAQNLKYLVVGCLGIQKSIKSIE